MLRYCRDRVTGKKRSGSDILLNICMLCHEGLMCDDKLNYGCFLFVTREVADVAGLYVLLLTFDF